MSSYLEYFMVTLAICNMMHTQSEYWALFHTKGLALGTKLVWGVWIWWTGTVEWNGGMDWTGLEWNGMAGYT